MIYYKAIFYFVVLYGGGMGGNIFTENLRSASIESVNCIDQHDEASVLAGVAVVRTLPPLHRQYAIRRGMKALGLQGVPPTIDDLMVAAAPPVQPKVEIRRFLSPDSLHRWALEHFLGDHRFDDADGNFDFHRAMSAANQLVGPEAHARHKREHADAVDRYHHEKAIFDQWHGLARWLAVFVSDLAEWVSDSSLTAISEANLQRIATQMASKHKADIGATRRASRSAGHPLADLSPMERRLMCPQWWRRRLRRRAAVARQVWSAALQTAGGRHGAAYVDSYSMTRWKERQEQATVFGDSHAMVGDDGTTIPMRDVMQASAAAALSRAYVMMLGVDEIASREGMVPIFLTITLPAEYHPNPILGACTWRPQFGPKKADTDLAALWRRFRARLQKKGIAMVGMRVIEGHADGTPHLHALLYVDQRTIAVVDGILQDIRPEPVPGERIATQLVVIDRTRGRATSYIAKTLVQAFNVRPAFAIRDRRIDADARHEFASVADDDGFDRHRALAAERGWRRFQLLGVHGIQRVWQAIFTMRSVPGDAPQPIRDCHRAMRDRCWGDAILALGALRRDNGGRVRLGYDLRQSRYGEMSTVPVSIVDETTGWSMPIRRQVWKIQRRPQKKDEIQSTLGAASGKNRLLPSGHQKNLRSLPIIKGIHVDKLMVTFVDSDPRKENIYHDNAEKYPISYSIDVNIFAHARGLGPREVLRDP